VCEYCRSKLLEFYTFKKSIFEESGKIPDNLNLHESHRLLGLSGDELMGGISESLRGFLDGVEGREVRVFQDQDCFSVRAMVGSGIKQEPESVEPMIKIEVSEFQVEEEEESEIKQEFEGSDVEFQEDPEDEEFSTKPSKRKPKPKKDLTCHNCGVTFASTFSLNRHKGNSACTRMHSGEAEIFGAPKEVKKAPKPKNPRPRKPRPKPINKLDFKCPGCALSFSGKSPLRQHMRTCCPEKGKGIFTDREFERMKDQPVCKFCKKLYFQHNALLYKSHVNQHTAFKFLLENERIWFHECEACKDLFKNVEELEAHVLNCEGDPDLDTLEYSCLYCEEKYDNQDHLKEHVAFKHMEHFRCSFNSCGVISPNFRLFYYHLQKSHTGFITNIESYSCDYCPKAFKTYKELQRHRKSNNCEGKTLECDHCDRKFGTKDTLKAHLRESSLPFVCEYFSNFFIYSDFGVGMKILRSFPKKL
jgi:hypothetical protein